MTVGNCPLTLRKKEEKKPAHTQRGAEESEQRAEEKGGQQGRQIFLSTQSHTMPQRGS